jgi:membrane-bound metal-dependent hydrolase YbcI (DUF457 family)
MRIEFHLPEGFVDSVVKPALFAAMLAGFLYWIEDGEAWRPLIVTFGVVGVVVAIMVVNLLTISASLVWMIVRERVGRAGFQVGPFSSGARKSLRRTVEYTDPFR